MTLEELRALKNKGQLNKAEKMQYHELWKRSSLRKSDFCRQEAIAISTFSGWNYNEKTSDKESGFLPLEIKSIKTSSDFSICLKIHLPNGLQIEGNFKCSELKIWIKELSHALTTLY